MYVYAPLTCDDLPGAVGVGGEGEEEGRGSFLLLRVAVLWEHGQAGGERRSLGEPQGCHDTHTEHGQTGGERRSFGEP